MKEDLKVGDLVVVRPGGRALVEDRHYGRPALVLAKYTTTFYGETGWKLLVGTEVIRVLQRYLEKV